MTATYNYWIVALSFAVAFLAAYRAIYLAQDLATCSEDAAKSRIVSGAVTLGTGVWSMHFVGMLALHLPIPVFYDPVLTLISGLFAIAAMGLALWQVRNFSPRGLSLLGVAIAMGTGIAVMHYVGMAAMRMRPSIEYTPWLFVLSILIAISASFAAVKLLILLPKYRNHPRAVWFRLGSAIILAIGIGGMHYTGMAAAEFRPGSLCLAEPGSLTPKLLLALVIIMALLAILLSHFTTPYTQESKTTLQAEKALPILVLIILAAISFASWIGEREDIQKLTQIEFDHQAQMQADSIQEQLTEHEEVLYDISALYAASREVEPDEFRTYAEKLSIQARYQGIKTMGLLRPRDSLQHPRLGAAQSPASENGCFTSAFRVHDEDLSPLVQFGKGSAPLATLAARPPLVWSPQLKQGLSAALISEKPSLIRLPKSLTGASPLPGSDIDTLLVYALFHNGKPHHTYTLRCSNLLGWVYAGINLNTMLQTIRPPERIHLDLYEGARIPEGSPIWSNLGTMGATEAASPAVEHIATRPIQATNNNWTLQVTQTLGPSLKHDDLSTIIPILGLASALFMAALVFLLNQSRIRAFTAANALERELTERQKLVDFITEQNLQLEHTAQVKSQFLSTMSHELRTPLNSILGFSEILADAHKGPLNEAQQHMVHHIQTSGKHLLSLVNDTLDIAKIEAGRMDLYPERMDAYSLVSDSLSSLRGHAALRHIALVLNADENLGLIWIDARKIQQVLNNLLANAIKFSPNGSRITLFAQRVSQAQVGHLSSKQPSLCFVFERSIADTFLEIRVEDHGIGIAEKNFHKLFQPFSQLDSSLSRQFGGTGLGLALTKSLVEHLGGAIALQSTERQGSCFTVWIPWLTEAPALLKT